MAVYDKRAGSFLSFNIPSKPAYGVYISQPVGTSRICSTIEHFSNRHYKLTEKGFWWLVYKMIFTAANAFPSSRHWPTVTTTAPLQKGPVHFIFSDMLGNLYDF